MIILNEREEAEKILYEKDLGSKPFFSLTLLAKYYYHCLGYRKKKITELLTDFMQKYYPRYSVNISAWNDSIEKIAKNVSKYQLYEINDIGITDKELETIQNIHNRVLERLAFTVLCISKLNHIKNSDNQGWVNTEEREIFKMARISCSVLERNKKLGQLCDMGLIEFPKKNDNMSFRVTFISDGEVKLRIKDFRELGYEYRKYCGEDFIRCAQCGRLMKNSKMNNRKYCSDCAGYTTSPKYKTIHCIDCGKEFDIPASNKRTIRCTDCQQNHVKEYDRQRKSY